MFRIFLNNILINQGIKALKLAMNNWVGLGRPMGANYSNLVYLNF